MKRDARAPIIRLLTVPQAACRLGLTASDVDRLVESGYLHAVHLSPHGGRRFWPADVEACAKAGTNRPETSPTSGSLVAAIHLDSTELGRGAPSIAPTIAPTIAPSIARVPPHRARTPDAPAPKGPRWPRFEVAAERASSNYLAFRDAEHVTSYLRARATLALSSGKPVHDEPSRRSHELVTA